MADNPFNHLAQRYDDWFDSPDGAPLFALEVRCVRSLLEGAPHRWLEVGVGTGRFAEALGVEEGLDPSPAVLEFAARRSITVSVGAGEQMPYADNSFGGLLMVVTICFLDDPGATLRECARVMAEGGALVIGLVPADSSWGQHYVRQGEEGHAFYSRATFYTCQEVISLAGAAGLMMDDAMSCLFTPHGGPIDPDGPLRSGIVEGAGFVAMRFVADHP